MSLVYAVRDSSPACPRSCVVEAMSWRAHLRWWALLQTLFHALATAPPYLATEVESNSLRSREVTLGTSRYQIPRSGLVQEQLWNAFHNESVAPQTPSTPASWMFLQRFPTPQALQQAGKRRWENFLHVSHLWRDESGPRRLELFAQATDFCGSAPTAKSQLALSLVSILFAVEKQLGIYRKRIEELFGRHPDHDLFGSLPGAGLKLAPRLLSEIGDDRDRFGGEPQALQCLAGTAPVTRRTGKSHSDPPRWPCHQRWTCDKHLRHAVHLLAEKSLTQCAWAEIYYRRHREKGRSHADALRRLGQRWLKIIHRMWMDRQPYDAMLHNQNQLRHGSWVLQLKAI